MSNQDERERQGQLLENVDASNAWAIHYSCSNFEKADGGIPTIGCIAVKKLDSGKGEVFSGYQDEATALQQFSEFMRSHKDCELLHWNLEDGPWSWEALRSRTEQVLGSSIDDPQKIIGLSNAFWWIYGDNYTGHPRLDWLIRKNDLLSNGLLTQQESENAFHAGEFGRLLQNTNRRVRAIVSLFWLHREGTLKTLDSEEKHDRPLRLLTSWREITGALELEPTDKGKVKSLNDRYSGPIPTPARGSQPIVAVDDLVNWWNSLREIQENLARQAEGKRLAAETTYQYGQSGIVAPEVAGSVKKRRSRKKT